MKLKIQKSKKKEDKPLKISGSFDDVLKVAVSGNPKSKKQTSKKKS